MGTFWIKGGFTGRAFMTGRQVISNAHCCFTMTAQYGLFCKFIFLPYGRCMSGQLLVAKYARIKIAAAFKFNGNNICG